MSVSVHFPEIDVRYSKILTATVSANFFLPPHTFVITIASHDPVKLVADTKPLSPIVIDNGFSHVLAGQVLDQVINNDDTVTIRGCDYTWRFDGDLDPANKPSKDTNLLKVIGAQVAPFGFDTIGSDNSEFRVGSCDAAPEIEPQDSSENKVVPTAKLQATKAWEWLNQLTAKYGYYIQPGLRGNSIQVVKPEYNQPATYDITRDSKGSPSNFVLEREVSRGYKGVPTFVQGSNRTGTKKKRLPGTKATIEESLASAIENNNEMQEILGRRAIFERHNFNNPAPPSGLLFDGFQKVYNPMFITDRIAQNAGELANRLNREFFDFLKNTLVYTCVLPDHNHPKTNGSYTIDTIAYVVDDVAGLKENLYIAERTFFVSGGRETTRLTMIRPQSYQI